MGAPSSMAPQTTPTAAPQKAESKMPWWQILLIVIACIVFFGGGAYLAFKGGFI